MSSLNKNNVLSEALNWDGELLADIQAALKEKLREMDVNANGGVSSISLSVNGSNQLVVEVTRADGTKRAASYDVSNMIGGGGSVVMGRIVDGLFYPATQIATGQNGNHYSETPEVLDARKLYINMPEGKIYRCVPNASGSGGAWDEMVKLHIDSGISSTSDNPVKNSAIALALSSKLEAGDIAGKADKLAGMLHPGQWPKVVVRNITASQIDTLLPGDVYFDSQFYLHTNGEPIPLGGPQEGTLYYCLADNKTYYWRGNSWHQAGGSGNGTVQSVSVNGGQPQYPNGQTGNVNLIVEAGAQGPKGDTGNVQVDGNGNVLIVNSLTEGGTGAALSAEMGKRVAMLSGTFAAAWAHSKAVTTPFCWLWQESSVDNSPVCKPIWHVGNSAFVDAAGAVVSVDAAAVPQAPAFTINGVTPTNNSEVNKNTELVITPDTDSVLYYKLGSGSYVASDKAVTIVLDTAGETYAFEAYCTNNKGDSTHATLTLSVAGTALATIEAKTGSTMTGTSPNFTVNRGGYVTLKADGDLTYTTDGSDPTSSGTAATVNGPNASVDIQVTGSMTIKAFNTDENDDDSTVSTWSLSIEALAKPSFSQADNYEFPAGGGQLAITAPTGYGTVKVYYNITTDGTTPADPTNASTEYTGAITINADTKIKAIAYDGITASPSAVESASYTIAVAKMIITASEATTMDLGDTGLTELTINAGPNEFTPSDLGITSFADHTFPYLKFANAAAITSFDGGGAKFANLGESNGPTNWGAFMNASNLTSVKGIVIAGGCIANAFRSAMKLQELEISGTFSGTAFNAFYGIGWQVSAGCDAKILVSGTPTSLQSALSYCKVPTLTIAGLSTASGTSITSMFDYTTSITKLVCTIDTPPSIDANADWLAALVAKSTSVQIKVPVGSLSAYTSNSVWGNYASRISELSNN